MYYTVTNYPVAHAKLTEMTVPKIKCIFLYVHFIIPTNTQNTHNNIINPKQVYLRFISIMSFFKINIIGEN